MKITEQVQSCWAGQICCVPSSSSGWRTEKVLVFESNCSGQYQTKRNSIEELKVVTLHQNEGMRSLIKCKFVTDPLKCKPF